MSKSELLLSYSFVTVMREVPSPAAIKLLLYYGNGQTRNYSGSLLIG
jgi:hypothetical protein